MKNNKLLALFIVSLMGIAGCQNTVPKTIDNIDTIINQYYESVFDGNTSVCRSLKIYLNAGINISEDEAQNKLWPDGFCEIAECLEVKLDNEYEKWLESDNKERQEFVFYFKKSLFLEDTLNLLLSLKSNELVYAAVPSPNAPNGAGEIYWGIEIENTEQGKMKEAINYYKNDNKELNGFYSKYHICLTNEASLNDDLYSEKDVLGRLYKNEKEKFIKISDSEVENLKLNESLPLKDNKKRAWYEVIFEKTFKAQYSLEFFFELKKNKGVYFAIPYKDEDDVCKESVNPFDNLASFADR